MFLDLLKCFALAIPIVLLCQSKTIAKGIIREIKKYKKISN